MADRLIVAGLPKADVQVLVEVPRKGNLIARLRSKTPNGKKPILLMAHLDVVDAKREDWSMDPFKFIEKDGYYYARGSVDDKAMASMFVANLVRYWQEGYRPSRDIIIALTADEESGDNNGTDRLVAKHRDFIDAAFALSEGGGGESFSKFHAFEKMSGIESGQLAADFRAITEPNTPADAIKRLSEHPVYNATPRTTCVATLIEGGHAENALPQTAKAT